MPASETQTLTRAFAILDCFSPERSEMGVREIARQLGLSSSTVGRLLASMHGARLLTQNQTTRAYSLGPKVLAWAGVYTSSLDIRARARPVLEDLHRITRESISLYILDGDERVCVERIESPERIRSVVRIGERMPLHAGASGKILLAFLPPAEGEQILRSIPLKPITSRTLTDRKALERELAAVRRQGYAVSLGERVPGAASVAAPIQDASGRVIAALNISGPLPRFTKAKISKYLKQVTRAAAHISQAMGFLAQPRDSTPTT